MKKRYLLIPFLFIGCNNDSNNSIGGIFDGSHSSKSQELNYQDNLIEVEEAKEEITPSEYTGEAPNDPIYKYQWHLHNLNMESVWKKYRGKGIKVSVLDTGIEAIHEDLIVNIDLENSYRYSDYSNNPSPDQYQILDDPENTSHGTACAGIIGAEGWNDKGVIGVAPEVSLVSLNVFSTLYDDDFEDALGNLNVDVSSNSWGANDSELLYEDPSSLRGIKYGIENGRNGKGIIYTFASGNEGNNANFSELHGSRYVFNIGSVTKDGEVPDYSNFGDNLLVVAPAGAEDVQNGQGIFTTDLLGWNYGFDINTTLLIDYEDYPYKFYTEELTSYNGDYTGNMNGTSSAVPVASGIMALILQANPELTYREVKYIVAKTATVQNKYAFYYDWEKNGAGIYHSPYYGFGIINPSKAIEMAESFSALENEQSILYENNSGEVLKPFKIVSNEIEISENLIIEHVEVIPDIAHTNIGYLKIYITSPSGTKSVLMNGDKELFGTYQGGWSFNTLKFLDENSSGTWKISIYNRSRTVGAFNDWKIRIHGR
jgi:subtilisin family serine protease/subtilisin-like proprotein convertase family protein